MADMRCPMCGKPNPAAAETCAYCQARLKPLVLGSADDKGAASSGGINDWLNDLRPSGIAEDEPPAENDSAPLEDNDWFTRLEGTGEPQAPAFTTPDWLAAETPTGGGDPNIPDWMEDLGINAGQGGQEQPPSGESSWGSRMDTGSQGRSETGAAGGWQPPAEGDVPDWLSGFSSSSSSSSSSPSSEETQSGGSLPDWLNQFGGEGGAQPVFTEGNAEPAAGLPDWLSGTERSTPEESSSAEAAPPAWLSQFGTEPESPASSSTQGLPDWFGSSQAGGASPFGEEAPSSSAEPSPADDWFASAGAAAFGSSFAPADAEESSTPPLAKGDEPEWISRLGTGAPQPAASSVSPFVMDEEEEGEAVPLSALPDWISQVSAEQNAPPENEEAAPAAPAVAADGGLSPAMLPTWLEAMRPVEAAAPPTSMVEADAPVENAGPLAGLRGALPAEPEIARIRKPPVYAVKMQLSESHQARLNQLEEMLKVEGQAEPLPARALLPSQHALRILIFAALVAVIFAAFSIPRSIPLPETPLEEVSSVNGGINQLPQSGVPVLVAFDYEPAQSGEMEAILAPVLRQLIQRNAYITLVSTSPNGVWLSARLLDDYNRYYDPKGGITSDWMVYENQEAPYHQYVQLGYIPGGLMGLQAFAQDPRQILPYAFPDAADAIPDVISTTWSLTDTSTQVWQQSPWSSIKTIDQFALVMVATDDANVARAWIEQTSTVLSKDKLFMAVSAQIEPMVRPYFETQPRQLTGYVAGLTNAASYDFVTNFNGPARLYWNAFSASLLAACVLILIGVIWQIALKTRQFYRSRKQ